MFRQIAESRSIKTILVLQLTLKAIPLSKQKIRKNGFHDEIGLIEAILVVSFLFW